MSPACGMASWGPGLKSHLGLCGSTAKPKSRSPPFQAPAQNGSGVETDSKCRDQHQDPADSPSFIVHRDLFFLFLPPESPPVIPIPANPPHGEFPFFSSTVDAQSGVLICNDIQRQALIASVKHKTSQLVVLFSCITPIPQATGDEEMSVMQRRLGWDSAEVRDARGVAFAPEQNAIEDP